MNNENKYTKTMNMNGRQSGACKGTKYAEDHLSNLCNQRFPDCPKIKNFKDCKNCPYFKE